VITITSVLNNAGSFVLTDIWDLRIIFFGEDVAGDIGRILAIITEWPAIKTAGCDLDLLNAAIFGEFDLFCTTLTGVPGIVRMSVIEDVPVTIDLDDASVVIRAIAGVLICRFIRIYAKVAVADDYTAVGEWAFRRCRSSIAELMHDFRRIYEVEDTVSFTDGRSFKESMTFKSGSFGIYLARNNEFWAFPYRQHIRSDNSDHSAVSGSIGLTAEAGIKVGGVTNRDHTRIELGLITLFLSEKRTIFVVNMTVEMERSLRLVTLGNSYNTLVIKNIEEIIVSVRSLCHIRSIETSFIFFVIRIVCTLIGNTFISPRTEIIYRCGPGNIVTGTEEGAVIVIVRSVDI
jgi:hypothetical protein